jgi:hypothetical protein
MLFFIFVKHTDVYTRWYLQNTSGLINQEVFLMIAARLTQISLRQQKHSDAICLLGGIFFWLSICKHKRWLFAHILFQFLENCDFHGNISVMISE